MKLCCFNKTQNSLRRTIKPWSNSQKCHFHKDLYKYVSKHNWQYKLSPPLICKYVNFVVLNTSTVTYEMHFEIRVCFQCFHWSRSISWVNSDSINYNKLLQLFCFSVKFSRTSFLIRIDVEMLLEGGKRGIWE